MTLRNLEVEICVPETLATTLSELKKFEYLSPPLKNNKLSPKRMANKKAILDFPKVLNINIVASIIIVSIREIFMMKLDSFSSIFIANWKLNGNFKFIDQFIDNFIIDNDLSRCVVICPTSIYIDYISRKNLFFYLGAQNVSQHKNGAYTGEISCDSLSEFKVDFCIVGHSERRLIYNESNIDVNSKAVKLINNHIIPIICIGETLEEKQNGKTFDILSKQLETGIPECSNYNNTIIAYEPVWAIGSGLIPSLEEIDKTHNFIKNYNSKFNKYKILYGGSVQSINSKKIISLTNVDGVLIGGASLKPEEFKKIIQD